MKHQLRPVLSLRNPCRHQHADVHLFGNNTFDCCHQARSFLEIDQYDVVGFGWRALRDDGHGVDLASACRLKPLELVLTVEIKAGREDALTAFRVALEEEGTSSQCFAPMDLGRKDGFIIRHSNWLGPLGATVNRETCNG